MLHESDSDEFGRKELSEILEPDDVYNFLHPTQVITDAEVAAFLAKANRPNFDVDLYTATLNYLNLAGQQYFSAYSISVHHRHTLILPTAVHSLRNYTFENKKYHCQSSRESSSHIYYYVPQGGGLTATGCITGIWQVPLQNVLRTFFRVNHHIALSRAQQKWNPYSKAPCSLLRANIVLQELSKNFHIIESHHLICHLVARKLKKESYPNTYRKITKPVTAIVWSLDRGRKGP
jgi:hypothetical protein